MLTNSANISAPIRIMNSIEVVRALSTSAAYSDFQESARRARANTMAPKAPTPAPSTAVNTPP